MASVTVVCLATPLSEPSFVIEVQDPRQSLALNVDRTSLLARLTKSESDVAVVVAEGLSNEEAAERARKDLHAVKFLLHRAYQKLGVNNLGDDSPHWTISATGSCVKWPDAMLAAKTLFGSSRDNRGQS